MHHKALIFVTHDPVVSLLSAKRIVMKNGAVDRVIEPGDEEKEALAEIIMMDQTFCRMRELIRAGEIIRSVNPV